MTPVEAKKKIKMMKTGVFTQLAMEIVKYLHEVKMGEPPASVEEYAGITKEVLQVLSSRYSEVLLKKVVKVKQQDIETAINLQKDGKY